jgi:putative flippase GtrA
MDVRSAWSPEMLGQVIRFGAVGLFSTFVYAIVYWPLAQFVMPPMAAVPIAFGVAVCIGYVLHSRWSFRGHGQQRTPRTRARFLFVQTLGLALNWAFTWVLTSTMHGPAWWPLVPAVLVTPAVTFGLNRWWVFA